MRIENENSFTECLNSGINLFLGAGFSVESKGYFKDDLKSMPSGDALRKELLKYFDRDENSPMLLPQLCQILGSTKREQLNEFFRKRFAVQEYSSLYNNLERLSIRAIFTTNIDDLVFKIFEKSQKYYVNDISLRGPSIAGSSAIDYIALHGSVIHPPEEGMDFSPVEIASSFERDKDKWYGYIGRIAKTPTLYWGYRVEDAGVLQALSKDSFHQSDRAPAWVTIRKEDPEAIEYFSALGFQIIVADTAELLKYIGQLKAKKTIGTSKRLIDKRFSEYLLPAINKVPVRSLVEFYLGAEATWYDIFRGNLHRTKHFNVAQNCVSGGKNCILIGAPVTGKSTLLKQLANSASGTSQSLYVEDITPEKARLLIKDIDVEGVDATIYVDNAADAWEAINILSESPNVRIIAAERDYIFDSVSHRFSKKEFSVFDVSGLSPIDVQAVQDLIPSGIQRQHFQRQENPLDVEFDPTFFEVLDTAVSGHTLTDRFIEALGELKEEAPEKHDLLLLACYLYSCRVPTSVDVASAFLARIQPDPVSIFNLLESMNTLLSRYEGSFAESSQAYYVPRSRSVAEAVIKRANPLELKRLLNTFHSDVSPTKIPRYDIFRRMAYDANLTSKAFPEWKEGLEFYERCFTRDRSASFKQQGAIYLSRKRQYPQAFDWIDQAKIMAGKKAASVRNTYAVILFGANFDKPSSPEVISTLDESMEILQQCYKDDLRKTYHAKVFADQAMKYASKLPKAPKSAEYVEQASTWLNAELKQRLNDRAINQLLRSLRATRRDLLR